MAKLVFPSEEELDEVEEFEESQYEEDYDDSDEYDYEEEEQSVSKVPKPLVILIALISVALLGFMFSFLMPKPVKTVVEGTTTTTVQTTQPSTTIQTTTVQETTTKIETTKAPETTTTTVVSSEKPNVETTINTYVAKVERGEITGEYPSVMNDALAAGYTVLAKGIVGDEVRIVLAKGDNTIEFLGTYSNGSIILKERKGFIAR